MLHSKPKHTLNHAQLTLKPHTQVFEPVLRAPALRAIPELLAAATNLATCPAAAAVSGHMGEELGAGGVVIQAKPPAQQPLWLLHHIFIQGKPQHQSLQKYRYF